MMWWIPTWLSAAESGLSVKQMIYRISEYVLNPVIQIGFSIALIVLVWKIIAYIRDRDSGFVFDDKGKQTHGNDISGILWALVGLFIMSSAFFILRGIATFIGSDIPTP